MSTWIVRNFCLLLGGIVFLPIALFALIFYLGLGAGFTDNPTLSGFKATLIASSYLADFVLCTFLSLRRFSKCGNYGYWDMLPIFYFCLLVIIPLVMG